MRYIIVLKCQRRDQQWLGLVLHTSERVHCRDFKRRTRDKEAAILGCYGRACCPWTAWEKAVVSVSPDFSRVCEMCWVPKLRDGSDAVFHGRVPNFPRLLTKDSLKKRKTDMLLRCLCCHVIFHAWPCSFFMWILSSFWDTARDVRDILYTKYPRSRGIPLLPGDFCWSVGENI